MGAKSRSDQMRDMEADGCLYISVPYIHPSSLEVAGTFSSEQPECSLVYPEGTDWSCSLI